MALTARTVETLLDLVENKLGCMEVYDREDARELAALEKCRRELASLDTTVAKSQVIPFPAAGTIAS